MSHPVRISRRHVREVSSSGLHQDPFFDRSASRSVGTDHFPRSSDQAERSVRSRVLNRPKGRGLASMDITLGYWESAVVCAFTVLSNNEARRVSCTFSTYDEAITDNSPSFSGITRKSCSFRIRARCEEQVVAKLWPLHDLWSDSLTRILGNMKHTVRVIPVVFRFDSTTLLDLTTFCLCLIPGVVPLEDLPVLTKAGVSCSLAEYRRRLRQQEPLRHDVAPTGLSVPCVDVPPPPYVEYLKEDPFARSKDSQAQKEDDAPGCSPGHSGEQSGDHRGELLLYPDQPPY